MADETSETRDGDGVRGKFRDRDLGVESLLESHPQRYRLNGIETKGGKVEIVPDQ